MSLADLNFIKTCKDILENGTSTEGEKVRPHWEDGTSAYTLKQFGVVNRYDISKEFPAVTLRKTAIKSATEELLWIYQRKSNNIHTLDSHVWDEWADEEGSIGKAYGYQLSIKNKVSGISREGLYSAFDNLGEFVINFTDYKEVYFATKESIENTSKNNKDAFDIANAISPYTRAILTEFKDGRLEWKMDQVDKVIYDLKNTPFSRRIMTTTWNVSELTEMALNPCAYSMTFNVTQKPGHDKLTLNAILNQRSNDMLAAGAWNVAQYSMLIMMLAQVCDMEPGELLHVIADAHIYDRHIDMVKELISREPKPAPKVWLDPEIKDFYQFSKDSVHIENYEVGGPQIKDIPIAI